MKFIFDWDVKIFQALNSLAGKNSFLDSVIIFFAHYYIFVLGAGVALYFLFYREKYNFFHVAINQIIVLILARFIVAEIIRFFYFRARPFLSFHVTQLVYKNPEASFPSGHTIGIVALGLALLYFDKKIGILVAVSGVGVGVFRIIAGLHYPLDVLGGIILSLPSAWAGVKIYKYFIK